MIFIKYPQFEFKVEYRNNVPFIFDSIRRKWLLLQDEEWIRQNFVRYLIEQMNYPKTLIAIEKEIQLGELKKRFDILVYNKNHQPWMLVECKGDKIILKENVLHQALRYNISMPAEFLIITNGNDNYGWQKKDGRLTEINSLPEFTAHD